MKLNLCVRRMAHQCGDYVFDRFPLVIGRSADADVTLDDRWASRRHCLIEAHGGTLVVQDLGSKHGTLLNDAIISEAVLKPGDTLCIGLTTLTATYDNAEAFGDAEPIARN
ncbi:MAG: FHA domain-containing protein [Planctomycetia bacterium]|nr:FHA domain-containing protein [Planctomycetia bacterium]